MNDEQNHPRQSLCSLWSIIRHLPALYFKLRTGHDGAFEVNLAMAHEVGVCGVLHGCMKFAS